MTVFRLPPAMPVGAYKTYALRAPLPTHWRRATCAEAGCGHHTHGWATTVFAGSEDEAAVRASGRRFTAEPQPGGMIRFVFEAGQPCFRAALHRVPLEREPLYVVRGGDWRGNPSGQSRRHANGVDWVDDFGSHQDRIAEQVNRG